MPGIETYPEDRMNHSLAVVLGALSALLVSTCVTGKGPNALPHDVPDAFEVFANFPYGVGISDVNNDTIFECLTAKRKDFDPVAKTVTYVWSLNGGDGKRIHVGLYHTAGATPDATNFTVGKDSNKVEVAYFRWSDNKDCAITEIPYYTNRARKVPPLSPKECTLWVSKAVEDMVPVHCLVQFHDICGVIVPLRDSDLCVDDEVDTEDF